ncbi:unnamed protein product [Parajaminaea phylloscopi]
MLATASSASSQSQQPNTSLHVNNLNTKTKKPELRRQLYALFSAYGKVIDVVATRAAGMRGQAFVVFRDLASATAARRALEGFEFYERSLRISYANSKSKASLILERGPEAIFDPDLMSSTVSKAGKVTYSSAQADQRGRERKRQREEARQRGEAVDEEDGEDDSAEEEDEEKEDAGSSEDEPKSKIRKVESEASVAAAGTDSADNKQSGLSSAQAGQQEAMAEEVDEEEEEEEMDMEDSDSDDEAPGPPAP